MPERCVWDVTPDQYFEDNKRSYDFVKSIDYHAGRISDIMKLIKQDFNGKTLDIGAGTRNLGSESNIDLSFYSTSKESNNFVLGSGEYLPYKNETFDNVSMIEVIEHVHNPTQALIECLRVLKKGGKLHLTTPNLAHLSISLVYLIGHRVKIHCDHRNGWTWEMLAWLLNLCGFRSIQVFNWGFVDEMRIRGEKARLYRSYRICNFLDRLGFKFPFLYLNIYCKAVKT